jgi:hypothetical protein
MSDIRVALIAEGPTDAIIVEAALRALLPRPFVLTQLQPEPTQPKLGTGWGGVLRWCREFAQRGYSQFEDDPTLPGFDLIIVHLDADVAEGDYADVSEEVAALALSKGWPVLPNRVPCPPAEASADALRAILLSWAGLSKPGPRTALCIPSKAIDAWLAAALFDGGHKVLNDLECNLNLEAQLRALPKGERVRKASREYRTHEKKLTESWALVRRRCSQADRFSNELIEIIA